MLNPSDDLRQLRHEPLLQGMIGTVADAQPDDHRTEVGLWGSGGKVLVLGQNDRAGVERVIPNVAVLSFAQTDFPDGPGVVSSLAQPAGDRRWQWASTRNFTG